MSIKRVELKSMANAELRRRFQVDSTYSPDDGGWYCECFDGRTGRELFQTELFATEELAIDNADKRLSELIGGL